jgi:hypothetical protein
LGPGVPQKRNGQHEHRSSDRRPFRPSGRLATSDRQAAQQGSGLGGPGKKRRVARIESDHSHIPVLAR